MAHFVDGFGNRFRGHPRINLDHVAIAKQHPKDDDGRSYGWDCFDVNGDLVGSVDRLDEATVVVPNHTDAHVYAFFSDMKGWEVLPIVAWRIADAEVAEPITFEDLDGYAAWFIAYKGAMGRLPLDNTATHGTIFCQPYTGTVLGFEAALASAQEAYEANAKRAAEQRAKAAAPVSGVPAK